MSDHKSTLTAILVDGVSGPARQIKAEITGIGSAVGAVSSVLIGVGVALGETLFRGVEQAFGRLTEIIPDLIQKGNDYLEVLKRIQLETGLTAQQTSALAGIAVNYGVSTGELTTLLARLGNNVGQNEARFKAFGIATRDANGKLLDTWTMFQQVRQAIAAHGASMQTTAVATQLFGKNAAELLPILSLSDEEFKAAAQSVGEFGGIVSQAAIDGAEKFKRGLDTLRQGVVDIGTNIASALDPYLEQFIANFTAFVKAHLNDIINFFVAVTQTVVGFVSGLFGITEALNGVAPAAEKASSSTQQWNKTQEDTTKQHQQFTAALNDQIKAIDAQSRAITNREQARHAARERERLAQSLTEAQGQLADLRGNAPFTQGLSAAEQQLAIQKHAQDVIDAEKDVADKRKALGDFELDQRDRAEEELLRREKARLQDRLAATNAAFKAEATAGLQLAKGWQDNIGGSLQNIAIDSQRFGETARKSFEDGRKAADAFMEVIFGKAAPTIPGHPAERTGGLVGALGAVGDVMSFLLQHLNIVVPLIAAWLIAPAATSLVGMLGTFAFAIGPQGALMLAIVASVGLITVLLDKLITGPLQAGKNLNPYGPGGPPGYQNGPIPNRYFGPKPPGSASGGWVGVNGPELRMVGEEGPEYVVPNHQLSRGSQIVIHNHFDFISMPSRSQLRDLADAIDEIFQMKADNAPVGIRGFTGATG